MYNSVDERKHSLSTCGQTVYESCLVIHIIHINFYKCKFFRLFSKTLLFRPFKISRQSNRKEHEIQEIFLRALQHIFNLFQLFDKQIIDLQQL